MPPLLPIGNRRTRGVTLAAAPDDSSSQSDEESAPAGGKTARAARPLGGPTPRVAAAGPPAARAAPLSQPSPAVVTGPPRVVRVVKFAPTPTNQVVEVTPYSQVYGMNPAKFDFDPNAPNGIDWYGTPVSSPAEATGSPATRMAASLQPGWSESSPRSDATPAAAAGAPAFAPSSLTRSADGVLVAPAVYVTPPRRTAAVAAAQPLVLQSTSCCPPSVSRLERSDEHGGSASSAERGGGPAAGRGGGRTTTQRRRGGR
ncbi:unnamed protein product [Prorocentrum cordatum]|uniref:Uncharacterized protein n=1 Tax=Prorocentrum cordatum TaxID=2364126 RepID=A0ABN9XZ51_9DINO|nr:unnamed protein product [Polarella glacialis]